ncbi:MAG TPA: VOC family protein, partial [Thermodesulfobacteriota bacterium]|nr:VOC family protein [Thermodesulfobacteriota bacterium]
MEPRISLITLGVEDLGRSYRFYKNGLGLPTTWTPDKGVVFFKTRGTVLALYPLDKLAEDIDPSRKVSKPKFSGVAL